MTYALENTPHTLEAGIAAGPDFTPDLPTWLLGQARQYSLRYLLAHADDGVIWGYVDEGGLHLSGESVAEVATDLNPRTLQQARLFGPQAELFLYRTGAGWTARVIRDGSGDPLESFTEKYWLWGTLGTLGRTADGFTLLVEGKQGLRHAPPVTGLGTHERVTLSVRHYIDHDGEGQAFIRYSRLMDVQPAGGEG